MQNPSKANFVERVQGTIKTSLYRMMRRNRSYRYIDCLENIVANYNNTPHSGLNGLTPMQINKTNESDVWVHMYLKKKPKVYKVSDLVRISFTKQPFRRAYQEQFTTEVFKVSAKLLKQGIPMYKLQDLKKDNIKGLFYTNELQKVQKDENSLWFIQKTIRKRRWNNKLQYFVEWQGFPKTFSSWIDAADVKDVSESAL